MKTTIKYYIEMDDAEKSVLLGNARDVDEGISGLEFVDIIDNMLTTAYEIGLIEGKKR